MKNLDLGITDGRIKIYINKEVYGDDRVIYVNPSDTNIFTRTQKAIEKIKAMQIDLDNTIKALAESDKENPDIMCTLIEKTDQDIKKAVNDIFNYDVSTAVFGETSAMANINGVPFIEVFLNAMIPVIQNSIEEQSSTVKKRNSNIKKQTTKRGSDISDNNMITKKTNLCLNKFCRYNAINKKVAIGIPKYKNNDRMVLVFPLASLTVSPSITTSAVVVASK